MGGKGVQGAHQKHIKSCYTLKKRSYTLRGTCEKKRTKKLKEKKEKTLHSSSSFTLFSALLSAPSSSFEFIVVGSTICGNVDFDNDTFETFTFLFFVYHVNIVSRNYRRWITHINTAVMKGTPDADTLGCK